MLTLFFWSNIRNTKKWKNAQWWGIDSRWYLHLTYELYLGGLIPHPKTKTNVQHIYLIRRQQYSNTNSVRFIKKPDASPFHIRYINNKYCTCWTNSQWSSKANKSNWGMRNIIETGQTSWLQTETGQSWILMNNNRMIAKVNGQTTDYKRKLIILLVT